MSDDYPRRPHRPIESPMRRVAAWSPDARAKFIVWTAAINFVSLALLAALVFTAINGVAHNAHNALLAVWTDCQHTNQDARSFNALIGKQIAIAQSSKLLTQAEKDSRLKDYNTVKRKVRACGAKP